MHVIPPHVLTGGPTERNRAAGTEGRRADA
ncbi:hypothetical protein SAMN05428939_0534 [Streptomyces sp. TLI_105]|nr:hypothetical protein SAMN05428939_0534 [Streptomyces sp. TLI_105]